MDFHILSTHTRTNVDATPLQLISAELLAHYQATERAYLELCAAGRAVSRSLPPAPAHEAPGAATEAAMRLHLAE